MKYNSCLVNNKSRINALNGKFNNITSPRNTANNPTFFKDKSIDKLSPKYSQSSGNRPEHFVCRYNRFKFSRISSRARQRYYEIELRRQLIKESGKERKFMKIR